MSIQGGPHTAFARAEKVGCECMAMFVKNKLQWTAPRLLKAEIDRFHAERERTGIGPLVAHATYLINLAGPVPKLWRRSVRTLAAELKRCKALGIEFLVVHPGSHKGRGEWDGLRRIADALRRMIDDGVGSPAKILLEITAGGGNLLGGTFEQLADMIALADNHERLGVCLDTAHLHAAGYDLRTDAKYEAVMRNIEETVTVARVHAIHINDTNVKLATHRDRHAHIGTGLLKRSTFRRLIADPRWSQTPMLLETPKGKDEKGRDWDTLTLTMLKRIRDGASQSV